MNIISAANYIYDKLNKPIEAKLHTLLYYCQAWSLVWDNRPFFDTKFQAWSFGPVIPHLWIGSGYSYSSNCLPLTEKEKSHIDKVLYIYGNKPAITLYDIVASELPYTKSRIGIKPGIDGNNYISTELMQIFYSSLEEKKNKYNYTDLIYDPRNITDEFKFSSNEKIKSILKERSLPYSVLMQHIEGDWNISTVLRNANAFGAREMFYFGKKSWDRRGGAGVRNYTTFTYLDSIKEVKKLKENSSKFVVLDNIPGAIPIYDYKWERDCVLVLGEENSGVCKEVLDLADDVVMIPQLGSVRSVNVGVASGIAMNDIVSKMNIK
jgi:tRNA G18 (ribose-2'-O)-methylase SpoU/uncharacterized phage-associated protein